MVSELQRLKQLNKDLNQKLRIKERNTNFLQPAIQSVIGAKGAPTEVAKLQKLLASASTRLKDLESTL